MGLVSLKVFGSQISTYEASMMGTQQVNPQNMSGQSFNHGHAAPLSNELVPRNMKMQNVDIDSFDPILKEKVLHYEYEKQRAVEEEDYEQAKYYKQIVDKMKVLGN